MPAEIKCSNCFAVCCGPQVELPLTDEEVVFLKQSGRELEQVIPPLPESINLLTRSTLLVNQVSAHHGVYLLTNRCGYAEEKEGWVQCNAKKNPRRPKLCHKFKEGGTGCKIVRQIRGVD